MTPKLDDWRKRLQDRQRHFLVAELQGACQFLREAREEGKGWGPYPGLPSDLHHSALALEALAACRDDHSAAIIADAILYLREEETSRLDQLGLAQLADFVTVLRTEELQADPALLQRTVAAVRKCWEACRAGKREVFVRDLGTTILALTGTGGEGRELARELAGSLLKLQRPDDGAWPAVEGEEGSVIATALAVQVLSGLDEHRKGDPLARGLRYLYKFLEKNSWKKSVAAGDIFTQAVMLRALAHVPDGSYEELHEGIGALAARRNADGAPCRIGSGGRATAASGSDARA